MKNIFIKKALYLVALLLALPSFCHSQKENLQIEERNVRAHMEFLASDALQGRGSGTQFEWLAGQYIASQLQQFGIEPAGNIDLSGQKTYIQTVNITRNSFEEEPKLSYSSNGQSMTLNHGKEMIVMRMNAGQINGALQKITLNEKPKIGAIAFIKLRESDDLQRVMQILQAFSPVKLFAFPKIFRKASIS